ncbi:MAG: BMP family ABC transporter substrate-binding protein [Gammaproteobacteria bacterium]|nr:BMP family ABC transporter substrate-binding protein [Gammaproteobacteria bacterium]MDH3534387.1 BMP family ABC transporter substrate-binding protein [Gammaproteobacteria bacterium]
MTVTKTLITRPLLAAFTALAVIFGGAAQAADNVGFVYVSPIGDAGWTYQHNLGRLQVEKETGATTKYVENVAEGADAERVIREMAKRGDKVIFATSFGYMNYMLKVSKSFPKTAFVHVTGYKLGKNMGLVNARFYEGRYLTGVIAGEMTRSNVLGYVAAFPIPEVLQGINAFIKGARSVNPKAELRVIWVNSWYDPGKERQAAATLISQGADVITHHTDSTAVVQTAEDEGIYAFGYHSDMSKYGPKAHLTATTHLWGDYYVKTVKDVLAGTWTPTSVWGGYPRGMIKLAPMNKAIPEELQNRIRDLEKQLTERKLHPFAGPVIDQSGKTIVPAGKNMTDDELNKMNYYLQGVVSKIPN